MRLVHFIFVVCVLSFSIQSGSCSYIFDILQQAIHTKIGIIPALIALLLNATVGLYSLYTSFLIQNLGVIKDLPKRIPTLSEIFEFGKNALIGLPFEVVINVIHEFCKCSVCRRLNTIGKTNANRLHL